jgi:GNAT superfamily N-acetyltransferase
MITPPIINGFTVRALDIGDVPALRALFDADPEFFRDINGRDIPVEEIRTAIPPGRSADDKFLFVLDQGGRVEGIIDLIRGYPERHIWHLGFVFLSKRVRGGGQGRRCLHALYDWTRGQGGTVMRLGVVEPNAKARHLYATEGFVLETTREVDPSVNRARPTLVLRRPL